MSDEPIGRRAYAGFADRYAALAPTKPHNTLYERPATLGLMGDVDGLDVLDAGCGPGIASAALARRGARVHGFDVTPEMVRLAREACAGLPVEIVQGDLTQPLLWLAESTFDKVLSALALDYVEHLAPVFAEFRRVARPGAALVFSMSHPMRDWGDPRTHGGGTYFDTTRFGLEWSGFGEPRPFVEAYRRPLHAILDALLEAGWTLDRLVEPRPLPEMRERDGRLYAELMRAPAFLCVRARRA